MYNQIVNCYLQPYKLSIQLHVVLFNPYTFLPIVTSTIIRELAGHLWRTLQWATKGGGCAQEKFSLFFCLQACVYK